MMRLPLTIELELEWDDDLVDSPDGDIDLLVEKLEEAPVRNVEVTKQ